MTSHGWFEAKVFSRVHDSFLSFFICQSFFKYGPSPASFSLFSTFQLNITIFTTNKCEKCPSSIWHWDLNPWPLEHESPPITTWPGIPPYICHLSIFVFILFFFVCLLRVSIEWRIPGLVFLSVSLKPSNPQILMTNTANCTTTPTCNLYSVFSLSLSCHLFPHTFMWTRLLHKISFLAKNLSYGRLSLD